MTKSPKGVFMPISSSLSYTDVTKRETKSHGTIDFPGACYEVNFPETHIAWHWHNELEFILVTKGELSLMTSSNEYVLKAGMGAFVNADILHTATAFDHVKGAQCHSIVFHPRLIGGFEDSIYWQRYLLPLIQNMDYNVQTLDHTIDWQSACLQDLSQAWEAIANDTFGYELLARNYLSNLILKLNQNISDPFIQVNTKTVRNEKRLKQMISYIHNHYYEPITLKNIAEKAAVSPSECLRCFKNLVGMPPLKYVNHYRLLVAAQRLRETDWSISDIGYSCGFSDMGYFSGQFKKQFKMTPSAYRALKKR